MKRKVKLNIMARQRGAIGIRVPFDETINLKDDQEWPRDWQEAILPLYDKYDHISVQSAEVYEEA